MTRNRDLYPDPEEVERFINAEKARYARASDDEVIRNAENGDGLAINELVRRFRNAKELRQ